jgi:histidine triad (HIT) family protein
MSIDGVYDPDNIFAKVLRGEAPAAKVFEDGEVLAFMDLFPQSRGHTLVISKTAKARNLLDVAPDDLAVLMKGVQRVAKAVHAALKPDGIIVTQFNGAPAGQTVFHLHVHIIPRWENTPMAGHGGARMADTVELAALAKAIGAEIA